MYVKIANGAVDQYPYTVGDLRRDNPNTSFPKKVSDETLKAWDVYRVTILDAPEYTSATQKLVKDTTPTLNGETWQIGWSVVDKTQDEIDEDNAAVALDNRLHRNRLIAETDWWASSDLTMTAEQTAYRQALRDITTHANWPHLEEADWPVKQ
jgi:hypothetical protein